MRRGVDDKCHLQVQEHRQLNVEGAASPLPLGIGTDAPTVQLRDPCRYVRSIIVRIVIIVIIVIDNCYKYER